MKQAGCGTAQRCFTVDEQQRYESRRCASASPAHTHTLCAGGVREEAAAFVVAQQAERAAEKRKCGANSTHSQNFFFTTNQQSNDTSGVNRG